MAYYRVCPDCGCTLDPGERCDCQDQRKLMEDRFSSLIRETAKGQMEFRLEDEYEGGKRNYGGRKIAV